MEKGEDETYVEDIAGVGLELTLLGGVAREAVVDFFDF